MPKRPGPGAQSSLFHYFAKTPKTCSSSRDGTTAVESTSQEEETMCESQASTATEPAQPSEVSEEIKKPGHPLDVGKYVNQRIDDEMKLKLLSTPWIPEDSFQFPVSEKRNLRFQRQWLTRYSWLVYTETDGALCKYCVLFSKEFCGKGFNQKVKSLVKEPYKNWKDALETFTAHEKKNYHQEAMIIGTNFLKTSRDRNLDIRNIADAVRKKQVEENRNRLFPIVETIKLCGRQELALRGTDDSGPILVKSDEPVINDGNFRALLRMRIKCGDDRLIKHVENVALNASYVSSKIQNELINICGEIVQKQIVKNVNDAQVFSILVDETADISRQ
ncbi:zinc finger MYM-type protein 1-like [Photinus pyralis]|uniref:zinc finger MYM-type protein 1-like n=1 Tax=Photinus pyralis TaxID=7054 RepID=UPI001266EEA4|nr:zinc finger MYM-type protein 1-like [Photinus pyralis]